MASTYALHFQLYPPGQWLRGACSVVDCHGPEESQFTIWVPKGLEKHVGVSMHGSTPIMLDGLSKGRSICKWMITRGTLTETPMFVPVDMHARWSRHIFLNYVFPLHWAIHDTLSQWVICLGATGEASLTTSIPKLGCKYLIGCPCEGPNIPSPNLAIQGASSKLAKLVSNSLQHDLWW